MTSITKLKSKINPYPVPFVTWTPSRNHHARLQSWKVDNRLTVLAVEVIHA